MRGGAARREADAGDALQVEVGELGRQQVVGEEDRVVRQLQRLLVPAAQDQQDAPLDVEQVLSLIHI